MNDTAGPDGLVLTLFVPNELLRIALPPDGLKMSNFKLEIPLIKSKRLWLQDLHFEKLRQLSLSLNQDF